MENHRWRPEVVEALKTGSGFSFRYSTTTGEELFYRAFLQDEGESQRIVRLAIALDKVAGGYKFVAPQSFPRIPCRLSGRLAARFCLFPALEPAREAAS